MAKSPYHRWVHMSAAKDGYNAYSSGGLLDDLEDIGPFGTVYIDPPWPGQTGLRRQHYRSMRARAILGLPIASLAAPNSVLLLWSTWLHLSLAMRCMEAWGYRYTTGKPWLKTTKSGAPHYGLGIWFQGCTELLLIGVRGKVPNPRPASKGLVVSQRGKHSAKPDRKSVV